MSFMFYEHSNNYENFLTVYRKAVFKSHGRIRRNKCKLDSKKNVQVRRILESIYEKKVFKNLAVY